MITKTIKNKKTIGNKIVQLFNINWSYRKRGKAARIITKKLAIISILTTKNIVSK